MPTAKIAITVTDFNGLRDLSDPARFCLIADPNVTDTAGGRVRNDVAGDARTFRVTNGKTNENSSSQPVDMEFTILGKSGEKYVVAGLIFNQHGLADNGGEKGNFSIVSIKENVLTLRNNYTVGKTFWDFYIAIQQETVAGQLGLIDPGVENSENA